MTTVGILGTGGLARMMLRGLQGAPYDFVLSPRGAATAAELAGAFGATVAADNQAVVDRAEAVFVCLPAAGGAAELTRLSFRPGQPVLSAMAGTGLARLQGAIGPARAAIAMMPGYANALGAGPSILFPGDGFWSDFLGHVGPVHVMPDEATYTAAAAFGALSGASFWWMARLAGWFEAKGLEPALARALVAGTLRGNAEVLLREPRPAAEIAASVTTPGGVTLQLLGDLDGRGALDAWAAGLDAILARLRAGT